jgi:hypothetical protein
LSADPVPVKTNIGYGIPAPGRDAVVDFFKISTKHKNINNSYPELCN